MKKTSKKILAMTTLTVLLSFATVGCGEESMNDATGTDTDTSTVVEPSTDNMTEDNNTVGDRGNDGVLGDAANGVGNAVGDIANGVGDAVGDVANGIGDAANDVVNGVENGIDNMANGFNTYDDASEYLIGKFENQDNTGKYEVRNKKMDLVSYTNGKQGYEFEIHNTMNGTDKTVGTFYVDKDNGKIYQKDKKNNRVTEYRFS